MKKFYIQINLKKKSSDSSSFENIEKNNFQVVIFSDEKKKNYENENDNFIINADIYNIYINIESQNNS